MSGIAILALAGCSAGATPVPTSASAAPAASAAAASAPASVAAKVYTIVFLNPQPTNPYWALEQQGLELKAKELGVQLQTLASGADVGAQLNALESAIAKKPDGIIIGPLGSKGIVPGIQAANAAGIPVLVVDTAVDGGTIVSLVQTDNVAASALAGSFIKDQLPSGGSVLMINGDLASQTAQARQKGTTDVLTSAGNFKLDQQSGFWDTNKAFTVAQNALTANANLVAIFNASDQMTDGAVAEIKAAGIDPKKIIVTGFDGAENTLKEMQAGLVNADVAQQPCLMAETAMSTLVDSLNGKTVEQHIAIAAKLITPANVNDWIKGAGSCSG